MTAPGQELLEFGVAKRTLAGSAETGDLHVIVPRPNGLLVAVIDGLGHGTDAAVASRVARDRLEAAPDRPVPWLVEQCHHDLSRTRGVVLTLASFDGRDETMTWVAVGNVEGVLLRRQSDGTRWKERVLMRGGIAGHRLPPLRTTTLALLPDDLVVFATDGVRDGFEDLIRLDAAPQSAADEVMARCGKATDDALVLVGRWRGPPKRATR
jgi:serine phosphatase RsbU (regulator of sigma subunit)